MPLTHLKGVGPALQKKFQQLGIINVQDLLFHLPLRYEDRTKINPVNTARLGMTVQLEGEIASSNIQFGRRRSLHCVLTDGKGVISLRFFHFTAAQKDSLAPGTHIRCYGEVRRGRAGLEIYHPEYKVLDPGKEMPVADSLTPIYPTTEGIQQARLRNVIGQALKLLDQAKDLNEYLPTSLIERFGLPSLIESIQLIHSPPLDANMDWSETGGHPGQRRLAFEELLAHRLCMRQFKQRSEAQLAPRLQMDSKLTSAFLDSLPFKLTKAQENAINEIQGDLERQFPMLRLLQGDVGSGKTVVAAMTALVAIASGYQVAIMAPTEILAEQHLTNFSQWFSPLGIEPGWLSSKSKGKFREQTLEQLASGEIKLIIGTHALFQDDVEFTRLGLVIIDEQHRFGVHQRLALRDKASKVDIYPHQLVMTATPIPRTLAMSAYADLDSSIINELPPGRTPVNTVLISNERRDDVVARIEQACRSGSQAYWVCTLIEESESLQAQAAEATFEQLGKQLATLHVGLVHGRMKPTEKQAVMHAFKQGHIQLLVATTVIEVGVDVPNASLMVIENPERLGLAQLHQLRGRVGRGSTQSHCLLLYQTPLSNNGKKRLTVMRESTDGFYIAEKDLELRGPGQVLGTQQTGLMTFRVADIGRDASLLDSVKAASECIIHDHPEIIDPLIRRWIGERIHFVNV